MATADGTSRGARRELLHLLGEAGTGLAATLAAVTVVGALLPLAVIAVTGTVVARSVAGADLSDVAAPLAVLAGLFAAQQVLGPVQGVLSFRVASHIDGKLRARAMTAAGRPPGVGHLEEREVQDLVELASGKPAIFRSATPGGAATALVNLTGRVVQAGAAAVLVARFSVALAAVLLATTLAVRRRLHRLNRAHAADFDNHIHTYRRSGYYTGLAVVPGAAKEIRVFGLSGWARAGYDTAWRSVSAAMRAVRHRTSRAVGATYLVSLPVLAFAFVVAGLAAADGRIDLATLAVVVQAARQMGELAVIGSDDYQIDFGAAALPAAAELQRRSWAASAMAAGTQPAAGLPADAIVFEGVAFAYPGTSRPVFERLDLVVPAGSSMAIVGSNGAGKTTLLNCCKRP